MGRRSRKRASRYENDQAGCMWGLISIFDFRYGRSTRKLLSDKSHASRNAAGSSGVETKLKMLTNSDEKLKSTEKKVKGGEESVISKADVVKTSVKELMEEEMFIEQDSKNHIEPEKKPYKESCGVNTIDESRDENLDLEGIMEELCNYHQKNPSNDLEEKLSAAIKVFTDERFKEDTKTRHSKEFVEALKTLSSNKELFLNLLKDPNSPLVKHIQSIDDSRLGKEQSKSRTHRSFFKRRSKSQESNPLEGNEKFQPLNRIVILKPGPTELRNPNNEMRNVENDNKAKFSFTGIKRKLKHAMGKEKHGESRIMSEKGVLEEHVGWSSPNRNHFYIEKFAKPYNAGKKEEKISKKKLGVSNIYVEAKKHLSEMLTNGDEKEVMMTRKSPKTLGRVLALPEYNYSAWGSPAKDGEATFITAQMRLSPRLNFQTQQLVQDDAVHLSSPNQEIESQPDNPNEKKESRNSCSSVTEETPLGSFEGGEGTVIETEYKQESGSLITGVEENTETNEVCEEERSFVCLKEDSFEEDPSFSSPLASPSTSLQTKKTEDGDNDVDKTERPSPVSVLDPFSEDEISPSTTKSRPAIQPVQIRFDEGICTRRTHEENEESAFEYVETVLLASGLNWDEYLSNRVSSNQLLHPSLFDEVELFSNRSVDDQKLLFDCMNEVLKEICEHYFDYSFTQHKTSPHPSGTSLVQEVWEGVEWHLLYSPPLHSLDQLVKKDIVRSGSWMDLRFETESLVIELVNLVLEEMVEETVFSL